VGPLIDTQCRNVQQCLNKSCCRRKNKVAGGVLSWRRLRKWLLRTTSN
jgi:hypothetical protein